MKKVKLMIIAVAAAAFVLFSTVGALVQAVAREFDFLQKSSIAYEAPYDNSVEAYRQLVNTYCATYHMEKYAETVMKMLSVYSETHTTDILNASFSYLNTKYEHKNEGITDPSYSISIGIAQLNEWAQYIAKVYNSNPIDESSSLLILLQAYELQDKSYIDYAFNGNGYSASNVVDYCSDKAFSSEKTISNINSNFASLVNNLILPGITIPELSGELEEWQRKVVAVALDYNSYSKNGIRTQGGYCLRFANDVLAASGVSVKRTDCAKCAGAYYGVSNDWNSIPVGALIYCNASQANGHVGVYIGDGYVVHCSTYKNSDAVLLRYASNPYGYVVKQPLSSFISGYHAKCWGFSGAMADKYPYIPGKYMSRSH